MVLLLPRPSESAGFSSWILSSLPSLKRFNQPARASYCALVVADFSLAPFFVIPSVDFRAVRAAQSSPS